MSVPLKTLATMLFVALLEPAAAAPTPVPGGANAVSAVSSKVGDTVFNGVLRIKIVALRDATDADHPEAALPDKKMLVMQSLLRNGAHDDFIDLLSYTLADKDDVSVEIPTNLITHANIRILQGAAGRQSAIFPVDKDFVPTKLIVRCETCGTRTNFRAVRFTIPAP